METQDQKMLSALLTATDEIGKELMPKAKELESKMPDRGQLARPTNTVNYIGAKIKVLSETPNFKKSEDAPEQKAEKLIEESTAHIFGKDPINAANTRVMTEPADIIALDYRTIIRERLPKILSGLNETAS